MANKGILGTVRSIIEARKKKKQVSTPSQGTVFLKPSEATPNTVKKITDSGATASVVSGTPSNIKTTSYVSGIGGRVTRTSTPSQTQYNLERERIRQEEQRRQQEIESARTRAEEMRKRQEAQRQRDIENKRLIELSKRAKREKEINEQKEIAKDLSIKQVLEREAARQRNKAVGLYVPPTDEFGRSEAFYVQKSVENQLNKFADNALNKLQSQVNTGKVSVKEANKKLSSSIDKKYNEIVKELEKKYPKESVDYSLGRNVAVKKRLEKELKRDLEKIEKKEKRFSKIKAITYDIRDFISGGRVTDNALNREQQKMGIKIQQYNLKYGGKELSQSQFDKAQKELNEINKASEKIEEGRKKLEDTLKRKIIGGIFWGEGGSSVFAIRNPQEKKRLLSQARRDLEKAQREFIDAETPLQKIVKRRKVGQARDALSKIEKGQYPIQANYAPPIIPAVSLPSTAFVSFGGTSKAAGNVRVTSVSFQQLSKFGKAKQIGTAKIYTVGQGKKSISITIGQVAKSAGAKKSIVIGIEGSISAAQKKVLSTQILRLVQSGKRLTPLQISRLSQNVRLTPSAGGGAVLVSKRGYYVKNLSPKLRPYMETNINQFNSISQAFNKKELTVLSGLSKTRSGDVSRFLGIIKDISKGGSGAKGLRNLSPTQLKQYQKALSQLSGAFTAAISSVQKSSPTLKIAAVNARAIKKLKTQISKSDLSLAETVLKQNNQIVSVKPRLEQVQIPKIKTKLPKNITPSSARTLTKSLNNTQKRVEQNIKSAQRNIQKINERQKALQRTRVKQKTKQRVKQKQEQLLRSLQATAQKQLQSLRQLQRTIQEQLNQLATFLRPPRPPRTRRVRPMGFPRRKKKKEEKTKKKEKTDSYNVYVKSGGRFLKANTQPLSRVNAENRAAYVVDHSTAVTAKIRPARKVKRKGSILPREVGARSRIKARSYRIVKGKRVPLLNTIIEKRGKPRINTRGEKRGLTAARLVKQLNEVKKKKKSKRKITSTNRKELLKRLEKARAVRMRNLKKRNKK
jgi:hypothetical protein